MDADRTRRGVVAAFLPSSAFVAFRAFVVSLGMVAHVALALLDGAATAPRFRGGHDCRPAPT